MLKHTKRFSLIKINLLLACLLFSAQAFFIAAQTGEELDKLKEKVKLINL